MVSEEELLQGGWSELEGRSGRQWYLVSFQFFGVYAITGAWPLKHITTLCAWHLLEWVRAVCPRTPFANAHPIFSLAIRVVYFELLALLKFFCVHA